MSLDTANINLIYDRTKSDETASAAIRKSYQTLGNWSGLTDTERAQLERGTLTYNTLNRVELAVKTLATALTAAGYPVEVTPVLKGKSRVPSGYTEVEWIQGTGSQYIDSGVTETADMAVSCHFDVDTVASDYLFGSQQNNSNLSYNGIFKNNMLEYNYSEIGFTAASSIELAEEVVGSTNNITINGVSHTLSTGTPQNVSMLIFGIRRNTGAMRPYGGQAKLRYFKIKKGLNTVRDFVPCKNPDGTVGLYDLVGGEFYGNSGTGSFTAGTEVGKPEDREWQEGDVLYRPQWTTYLDNVQKLRDAYYTLAETGELPAPGDKLGYAGANNIEKILADIDLLLDGMKSIYRRAGTFTAGGSYTRQMIRSI